MGALAGDLARAAVSALDLEIDGVVRRTFAAGVARWAVDTGRSKAAHRLAVTRLASGEVIWRWRNDTRYAGVIFDRELRPALARVRLITDPIRLGVAEGAGRIAQQITNARAGKH